MVIKWWNNSYITKYKVYKWQPQSLPSQSMNPNNVFYTICPHEIAQLMELTVKWIWVSVNDMSWGLLMPYLS